MRLGTTGYWFRFWPHKYFRDACACTRAVRLRARLGFMRGDLSMRPHLRPHLSVLTPWARKDVRPDFRIALRQGFRFGETCPEGQIRSQLTEVEYPLLRACSSSAALRAAGLHTHVRTHRTSNDPVYLHTYVYCTLKREGYRSARALSEK